MRTRINGEVPWHGSVIRNHSYRNLLGRSLFLLLWLWFVPLYALNPAKSVFQYNCRFWGRQNGLPANGIFAIAQTIDGYLWFGTPRGLVRFDGSEFKLHDLGRLPQARSSIITSLSSSKRGGLWFGLERGAFGFCDGRNITLAGRDEWGGRNLFVQSIRETRNGDVWIAAERLAGRLVRTNTFEAVMTTVVAEQRYNITAVCEDSRGRIWLGTAQQGLFCWQEGALTKIPDPALDDLMIRSLVEDKQGQIWVGTQMGLLCYDGSSSKQPVPFPWYETRALLVDREGVLWAGTSGGGLVRFLNGVPTHLRKSDGLADDFVTSLLEDKEGSLWVGTRSGLNQLSDVKIPTLGKAEGLASEVNVGVYASRRQGLWVATGDGFAYFDGAAQVYPASVGLRNPYILRILEARNGDLYLINASRDIEVFSGGKIVARHANDRKPTAIVEDAQSVVMAAGGTLYRVGTNFVLPYVFEGEKPPMRWVFCMAMGRDGSIWLAGNAGDIGICRVKDGKFTCWTGKDGLPDSKVLWVCEDSDGILWAGLEVGLARLKDGKIRIITQQDGLFDNIINAIVPDDNGSLWIDSSRGFFSVSRKCLNDFADGKTARVQSVGYDGLDAVKSSEKYQQEPSGCKTADGRVWFPTAQGIVMINPTNLTGNPVPPLIHIDRVVANGREIGRDMTGVPPGKGDLQFHYAGLSYIAPQKIKYRYRLDGYDKDWVEADLRRAAFYTNLKPGNYRFQVQACNEDGVWNLESAHFALVLRPHYYQTAWFYLLCGSMAVAGLTGIYRWRVSQLRRKQLALQKTRDLLEVKVAERTASLVTEVQQRVKAQEELESRKVRLEREIEERKRMEIEVERINRQLIDASRHAGQAEVASNVLHNVGNVLNSVNVSATVVTDRLRGLQISNLTRAAQLLKDHAEDPVPFLAMDEKGRKLPRYLENLALHLGREQEELLAELRDLTGNLDHIKEIVAMQQTYATVSGVLEKVALSEVVENALKMPAGAYARHDVRVVREYEEVPPILVDRHKVLQILINILKNANFACEEGGAAEKRVTVRIRRVGQERVRVEVADNGIGIAPENLTRIFSHGFTTRQDGHGFGLHSAALAAKEMEGTVMVHSDGLGKGASFALELPLYPKDSRPAENAAAAPAAV